MKLFTADQIRSLDKYTIENEPISSIDLMERASGKLFRVIKKLFKQDTEIAVFAGPGNNGGDGLALARLLTNDDYTVSVYLFTKTDKLSPDCKTNYDRLISIGVQPETVNPTKLPGLENKVVIDAIFGSGLSRKAEGTYSKVIQFINQNKCTVISVDVPSGLFCESNSDNDPESIIQAHYTISFQVPKMAYLFAENEQFTGHVIVEDIGLMREAMDKTPSPYKLIDKADAAYTLKKRKKFSHKGTYGHALLLAGSYGKMGAAILSSKACLKSGVGLLTTHVPKCGYDIFQTAVPEAMACIDRSEYLISGLPDLSPFNAIAIGPGIGTKPNTVSLMKDLLEQYSGDMVIDADGLNILSQNKELLEKLPPHTILTPHPGEFARLFGSYKDGFERMQRQIELSKQYNCIIVLKGAHTAVTNPEGECHFNTTGNPGMATAGSGDALTGMILSFLSQGYPAFEAAKLAVWLHGKSADMFVLNQGMEALTATDIINGIGTTIHEHLIGSAKENYF
ncbi:NAD(P)H-hydrate dehydratase [Saccharicrinis sp. FJH62]|uniref:NAD(P)H-hydrate dehydratase n=1 Tax=Saccharicrinis sp. FJH62 TaxID=3344657 RepID=UPI0035D48AF1